ncbi:hypothetical protein QQF64_035178 [Cirrhinus molitorella]|uniref:Uncharacterized protein n=1 Tax=Cirrhinus molitorella TaxID=172907 RepID=A0ABR3NF19_9TELE
MNEKYSSTSWPSELCGHTLQAWGPGFCIHGPSHPFLGTEPFIVQPDDQKWGVMVTQSGRRITPWPPSVSFFLMNENLYSTGEYFETSG